MAHEPFPHHRHLRLRIDLEADDFHELTASLRQFALDLDRGEHRCGQGVSAGWASSHTWSITEDPEMTGARYRQLLRSWREGWDDAVPKPNVPVDDVKASAGNLQTYGPDGRPKAPAQEDKP